jgi:transcription elongation factor Elf1
MDPMEYFFLDEVVFRGSEDSVQGDCPHCGVSLEMEVDEDNMKRKYTCENCDGRFQLN